MQFQGINSQKGKDHNRALILRLIKKHHLSSRKEITERTGLTKGAVTKIVNSLIDSGLLEETDSQGSDGRIKTLRMAVKDRYFLSFYLSRIKLTGAIIDFEGNIRHREEIYEGINPYDNSSLLENLELLITTLIKSCSCQMQQFLAVGVAVPGALTGERGTEKDPIAFDWEKLGLLDFFRKTFDLPVLIENNSNLAALAESWFGHGIETGNFIEYTIGAGIGAGVINQGSLYESPESHVCAIGHTTIDYKGEVCFCGNRGCLESVGGLGKLIEQYREKKGNSLFNTENTNFTQFITELKYILKKGTEQDPIAMEVIKTQSEILSIGIVTLINLYNPESIVITEDDLDDVRLDLLVDCIKPYVLEKIYPTLKYRFNIFHSKIGNDIYILGAYAMLLEYFFTNYSKLRNLHN
ncbi:MAG: ROK family transcriptional regulator [Spirochaetales bacterium]|nr:ROK family transcriptional regulator [Spirochaetales bacterium]